jgi:hypothetical protein
MFPDYGPMTGTMNTDSDEKDFVALIHVFRGEKLLPRETASEDTHLHEIVEFSFIDVF